MRGRLQETIEHFLTAVARDVDDRRAELRLDVHEAVIVDDSGRTHDALASNLSRTGVFVEGVDGLADGARITVRFQDGAGGRARVVRRTPTGLGLEFDTPLSRLPGALDAAA